LAWSDSREGKTLFRLAPFIVGIYEAQLETMDLEFARLFEKYMADGGAEGIMKPQPALHRVIPARDAVRSDWILPYDDVRKIMLSAKRFRVRGCICRVQQDLLGKRKCDFPIENCIMLSYLDRPSGENDISQEQALAILDQSESIGLVHTASNVVQGVGYICNCCGCCCGILRGITDWGIEKSVARANYYAVVDPQKCTGCRVCADRCQVGAISLDGGTATIRLERCIGCGLCVTGCPEDAVHLQKRREEEIVHPPKDYSAWESKRLHNRGVAQ
jgi:ferredoxin